MYSREPKCYSDHIDFVDLSRLLCIKIKGSLFGQLQYIYAYIYNIYNLKSSVRIECLDLLDYRGLMSNIEFLLLLITP